jgi:hypothetical protein
VVSGGEMPSEWHSLNEVRIPQKKQHKMRKRSHNLREEKSLKSEKEGKEGCDARLK